MLIKKVKRKIYGEKVLLRSLMRAGREQKLDSLADVLSVLVPDISGQYSRFLLDSEYLRTNVRYMHAFQISLVRDLIGQFLNPVIVDIGDSAGTHLQYLQGLFAEKNIRCLSVNIDQNAVEKIKKKGLDAVLSKAEDLQNYNIKADIFMCFEMLEHMKDPCSFLHNLSNKTEAQYLVITVPYVRCSRVGLYHIRNNSQNDVDAENTHIFELCPDDWKLIARFSGWDIVKESIYLQYPRKHYLRYLKNYWRKFDFEGFYGIVLTRDSRWSSRYQDW